MADKPSFEYFDNAPIIMSMIQFRYENIEDLDFDRLLQHSKKISKKFPTSKPQIHRHIDINELETSIKVSDAEKTGVLLTSNDEGVSLTINNGKFTFQSKKKYTGWEDSINEVMSLWEFFGEVLNLTKVSGLSVRTINRFHLPTDVKQIKDYFTTYIQSDTGTHKLSKFQFKYTSVDKENSMFWHIAQALEKPISDKLPYIFDIDVLITKEIENVNSKLLDNFNQIRKKKNFLFNDGITDKTKQLIR